MVAFVANLAVGVLLLLDLNPVMNLILTIPAIACTSTVACRCYVSLTTFSTRSNTVETHERSTWANGLAWFKRSFAQKRGAGGMGLGKDKDKLGRVSSVQWVHTVQDPDTLENGRMTTFELPSSTAVLAPQLDEQQQGRRSSGDVGLLELRYVLRYPPPFLFFFISSPLNPPPVPSSLDNKQPHRLSSTTTRSTDMQEIKPADT